jgi:hypothetical protein
MITVGHHGTLGKRKEARQSSEDASLQEDEEFILFWWVLCLVAVCRDETSENRELTHKETAPSRRILSRLQFLFLRLDRIIRASMTA